MATDFIYDYFIKPIVSPETQGYNLVNTGVYIVLLVIACAFIYLALQKKVTFNKNFFISLLPYILFGVSMRVVMSQIESGILSIPGIFKTADPLSLGFWFFTPGIWILTFVVVAIGLLISGVRKKLNNKRLFWFGAIIALPVLLFNFSRFNNWSVVIGTAAVIAIVSYGLCFLINKFTKYKILQDKLNLFIVGGQAIDGIASTVAIAYFNFSEQHVLSSELISINPWIFVTVKLALAALICWSLDDYLREEEKKPKNSPKLVQRRNLVGFVKVIIAILGFATGLASLLKLGVI